jgi:hypothetical protein
MIDNRRLLAGALGLTILLAACGGSAKPAASAAATDVPAATQGGGLASEAPAVTEAPEATEEATGGTGEQVTEDPSTVTGLAATMPEKVNGVTYQRMGFDGDQLGMVGAAAGLSDEQVGKILKDNGKTLNDFNLAIATPTDSSASQTGMIYAVQIEGVPAEKWATELGSGFDLTQSQTIAGKKVYGDLSTAFGVVVYPVGDTMYMLLLVDQKTAEDILSQLP